MLVLLSGVIEPLTTFLIEPYGHSLMKLRDYGFGGNNGLYIPESFGGAKSYLLLVHFMLQYSMHLF